MFKTRLLSGIVLVILAVAVLYYGGIVTLMATMLLALGGVFELLRIYKLNKSLLGYMAYAITIAGYLLLYFRQEQFILPCVILFVLIELAIYVLTYPKYCDKDIAVVFMSVIYVSLLMSYVYMIRRMDNGGALVVMIFVCSWVNDTCAYCAGVTLGKHKMCPKLSPKKSLEGLTGGLLGSALFAMAYGIFFNKYVYKLNNAPLIFAIVGVCGAMAAVIGDLAASAIKRNNDIKDYGKLIPGHGGVLDRFDSIIFTAPMVYYCFTFLIEYIGGK